MKENFISYLDELIDMDYGEFWMKFDPVPPWEDIVAGKIYDEANEKNVECLFLVSRRFFRFINRYMIQEMIQDSFYETVEWIFRNK